MKKILLIDDDKSALSYLVYDLRETFHFDVVWIQDASEVMEVLNEDYEGVILDIMMPIPGSWSKDEIMKSDLGLSTGLTLFKKIRSKNPKIPILIYSAKVGVILDEYSHYLRKPETIDTIVIHLLKLITPEN